MLAGLLMMVLAAQAAPQPGPPAPPAPPRTGTVVVETLLQDLPGRAPPPPEAWIVPTPETGARIVNMGEVFNEGNYPFWADRLGREGRLRFRVAVDAAGRALGCEVIEPSGVPDLDQPTCDLVMNHARFAPARDRRGRAIPGIFSRQVVWQLENRAPHPVASTSQRAIIRVDAAGHRQCRLEVAPGAESDPRTCQAYLVSPGMVATVAGLLMDRPGERDRWELVYHDGALVPGGPAGEGERIGMGKGEELLGRSRHRLTIDAAGNVTACTPIERGPVTEAEWAEICDGARKSQFEAGTGERTLVVVGATYLRDR